MPRSRTTWRVTGAAGYRAELAKARAGWLKDKFGQIVPTALPRLLADPDREKSQLVMQAMLQMGKIEIDELERAAAPA